MRENRDGFIFYRSFYEAIRELDFEEQHCIYEAIFEYQFSGKEPTLENMNGIEKAIWMLIKPQLDANNTRYENGTRGGRPATKTEEKPNENQNVTDGFQNKKPVVIKNKNQWLLESETETKPKEKEKEKEKVKVKENEKENAEAERKRDESASAPLTLENFVPDGKKPWQDPVIVFYLNNINPMPMPREMEVLESFQEDTPQELILYAMEKAVENKARTIGYIKAILNSWKSKGITTLAEAKEEKKTKNENTSMNDLWDKFIKKEEMKANGTG